MTLEELLRNQGIADDSIAKILEAMKTNKIYTASEENLDVRYGKLNEKHENLSKQHKEAQALIEELKKSNGDNEGLQTKVGEYQTKIAELTKELNESRVANAVKVALLSEKAVDVDYLTYKLTQLGTLELDGDGNVKDLASKVESLKKQYPNQFEASQQKKIIENPLKKNTEGKDTFTKEDINKMPYAKRVELYQKNPEEFMKITES